MTFAEGEIVSSFYERHPYPPPLDDLTAYAADWLDPERLRVEHHRLWPELPYRDDHRILVAGCGTSQAAKYAIRYPEAEVVGIDVSRASLDHCRTLADKHALGNITLHLMPVEDAARLNGVFDQIVCTGVLHHLPDPDRGLAALRAVLAPGGAIQVMVYAPYGRAGVYMMQDYCRRLGVGSSEGELSELVAALRELSPGHPISHLLRSTPDFQHDDALADALLHPRDRAYSVPQLLDLLDGAELRFGRWFRQAPYLPDCGSLGELTHGRRIAELPPIEQHAVVELYRGTMTRHSCLAYRKDDPLATGGLDFDGDRWGDYVPIKPPTVIVVDERLPPGAAAALLNRAHEFSDLVLFVDEGERAMFEAIDGRSSIGDLSGDARFFERLWRHDLVVFDTSLAAGEPR